MNSMVAIPSVHNLNLKNMWLIGQWTKLGCRFPIQVPTPTTCGSYLSRIIPRLIFIVLCDCKWFSVINVGLLISLLPQCYCSRKKTSKKQKQPSSLANSWSRTCGTFGINHSITSIKFMMLVQILIVSATYGQNCSKRSKLSAWNLAPTLTRISWVW